MNSVLRFVFVLCLNVPWVTSQGKSPLSHAEITVNERQEQLSQSLVTDALGVVLKQLTADADVLDRAQVRQAILPHARQWLEQYHYRQHNQDLVVQFDFDEAALTKALADQQISIWPLVQRPALLLLLLQDEILTDVEFQQLEKRIHQKARALGWPLLAPMKDMFFQSLPFSSWQSQIQDPLFTSYQSDYILVGKIGYQLAEDIWYGDWQLFWRDSVNQGAPLSLQWFSLKATSEQVINEMLLQTRTYIQNQHLDVDGEGLRVVSMRILGVVSHQDYQRVLSLLRELPAVREVYLEQLQNNEAVYRLELNERVGQLQQRLKQVTWLQPLWQQDHAALKLHYRLL